MHTSRVGVLVGDHADVDVRAIVDDLLIEANRRPEVLAPSMNLAFLRRARRCDWVVVDLTDPAVEILATFLHGQAIPLLRLRRGSDTAATTVDDVLHGDLPIGYRKDVVRWETADVLRAGLAERLDVILEEADYIGDHAGAERYFVSAAQRVEPVFLSYAGEDSDQGATFSALLQRRFTDVFDYRDRRRRNLPTGEPWIPNLHRRLGSSEVGVILHSHHYRSKPYCGVEEQHLYDRHITAGLRLLVVKLDDAPLPELLQKIQYENLRNADAAAIVDAFVDAMPPSTPPTPPTPQA